LACNLPLASRTSRAPSSNAERRLQPEP
jgi:hypothetical protein